MVDGILRRGRPTSEHGAGPGFAFAVVDIRTAAIRPFVALRDALALRRAFSLSSSHGIQIAQ
jgi:hypothetical protein